MTPIDQHGPATTDTRHKRLADEQEILRTCQLLYDPGDVIELRALDATTAHDRWPHTQSGYFDDPQKLAQAIRGVKSAKGIYIIPNRIDPDLLARAKNRIRKTPKGESTGDSNIVRRRWLLIDCDAVRVSGISSTDGEHEAALKRAADIVAYLRDCGWPDPVMADSGNGAHVLYRIDLPPDDSGLVQRCLTALATRFDDAAVKVDQSVFNPARIWKLYGTLCCKGDDIVDRPHRFAKILERPHDIQTVAMSLLDALASEAPKPEAKQPQSRHVKSTKTAFDLDDFIERHKLEVDPPHQSECGRIWTFKVSPMCEHDGDGPFLQQLKNGAIVARCHHDTCHWEWADLREKYEPKSHGRQQSNPNRIETTHDDEAEAPFDRNGTPEAKARPKDVIDYEWLSSAELDSGDFEQEYLIDNLLVAGQPCLISGAMKSMKTSIAVDLAISLATGGPFLGHFKVNRAARVAVMSGESGLGAIQSTARRVCRHKGYNLVDIGITWSAKLPLIGDPSHALAIERNLTEREIEILIVDPTYRALAIDSKDHGNLMMMGRALAMIDDACRNVGAQLVLVHHNRPKTALTHEPAELTDVSWAGFCEWARQWLLLSRREKYNPDEPVHRLWLSAGGSAGHTGLWGADIDEGRFPDRHWQVAVIGATAARAATTESAENRKSRSVQARKDSTRKAVIERIRSAMNHFPEGETMTKIRTAVGANNTAFADAFAEMIRVGELAPVEITKPNRKKPFDGYKRVYPRKV